MHDARCSVEGWRKYLWFWCMMGEHHWSCNNMRGLVLLIVKGSVRAVKVIGGSMSIAIDVILQFWVFVWKVKLPKVIEWWNHRTLHECFMFLLILDRSYCLLAISIVKTSTWIYIVSKLSMDMALPLVFSGSFLVFSRSSLCYYSLFWVFSAFFQVFSMLFWFFLCLFHMS